ncbi:hypothetical protein C8R46DRAFT_1025107 [Mycena filopes]|nr:hypothetical protein C8R46DRAFT_1025107 [Mycena filopes]
MYMDALGAALVEPFGDDISIHGHSSYLAELFYGEDFEYGPEHTFWDGHIRSRVVGVLDQVESFGIGLKNRLVLRAPGDAFPEVDSVYNGQRETLLSAHNCNILPHVRKERRISGRTGWTSSNSARTNSPPVTLVTIDGPVNKFDMSFARVLGPLNECMAVESPLVTGDVDPLETGSLLLCLAELYRTDVPTGVDRYRRVFTLSAKSTIRIYRSL